MSDLELILNQLCGLDFQAHEWNLRRCSSRIWRFIRLALLPRVQSIRKMLPSSWLLAILLLFAYFLFFSICCFLLLSWSKLLNIVPWRTTTVSSFWPLIILGIIVKYTGLILTAKRDWSEWDLWISDLRSRRVFGWLGELKNLFKQRLLWVSQCHTNQDLWFGWWWQKPQSFKTFKKTSFS